MDNETREMFKLIINKLDNLEVKVDNLEVKVDVLKSDVDELKIDVKANYKELLTLDERTIDIQKKLLGMEQITAQNLYDLTVMKQKRA
jgi:hypothetical protein